MDFGFIVEKIMEMFPRIGGIVLFLAIFGLLIVKLTKFYLETVKAVGSIPSIQNNVQSLKESTVYIPSIHDDIHSLKKSISRIENGLATLNIVLLDKNIISNSCYSQENSPRVMNPVGKRLYKESGAEKVIELVYEEFLEKLETDKEIKTLLELERKSLKVLLDNMDKESFKPLQDFAFEHPKFEGNPLTYTDILFVMSLELRDRYRKKHSELTDDTQ